MSELKLGTILTGKEERDAFHVAVLPVVAGTNLKGGQPVDLKGDKNDNGLYTVVKSKGNPIGIIDPFLPSDQRVEKDQIVYLWLMPNTVVGMRHHWQHPVIDNIQPKLTEEDYKKLTAQEWITRFASNIGKTYEALMEDAEYYDRSGYDVYDNSERYKSAKNWEEFWENYSIVTGKEVSQCWSPYTCSC